MLLVANINNALLKQKVEQHLVRIGEQLDLVNQLIYSVPTAKMIEAVALLFANFSKFLAKALKYYRKTRLSKLMSHGTVLCKAFQGIPRCQVVKSRGGSTLFDGSISLNVMFL